MKIIVIDDDPVVHILSESIIQTLNYLYVGYQSIAEVKNNIDQFGDALAFICDMNLSDGEGLDLIIPLKKKYPQIPFILMSAEKICSQKLSSIPISPDYFLPKPFTANQLIDAIDQTL